LAQGTTPAASHVPTPPASVPATAGERVPGGAIKLRFGVPIVSFDVLDNAAVSMPAGTANPSGGASGKYQFRLLEASLAYERDERWAFEGGAAYLLGDVGTALDLWTRWIGYLRAGPLLNLARSERLTTNFQPMLGGLYRGRYNRDRGMSTIMGTGMLAINATRWWPSGWGCTVRFHVGLDFTQRHRPDLRVERRPALRRGLRHRHRFCPALAVLRTVGPSQVPS
jgi:hypothetical protein